MMLERLSRDNNVPKLLETLRQRIREQQELKTIRSHATTRVHRMNVKGIIENFNGSIFTVIFTKKDGSVRTMNCRNGVKKHLKGGKNNVVREDRPYITVYDMQSAGYRTVNLSTLHVIKYSGEVMEVIG